MPTSESCLSARDDGRPRLWELRSSQRFMVMSVGFSLFTDLFIYGMITPIMPELLTTRASVPTQDREYWVSVLLITQAAASFACAPIFRRLMDSYSMDNVKRVCPFYIFGSLIHISSMLLFTLANSLPFYILARATQGAAMSMVFVAGYYLLIQSAPEDTLSYAFGNLDVFLAAGFIGGPLLGGFIYQFAGYHSVVVLIFFLLAMDLSSRSLIIVQPDGVDWPNSPEIDHHPEVEFPRAKAYDSIENSGRNGDITQKTLTMWQLMRDARVMIAAASMASYHLLITALENTLPIFVEDHFRWGSLGAGCIFVPITVTVFLRPLSVAFSDRFGVRANTIIGFVMATPCLICLRFIEYNTTAHKIILSLLLFLSGAFLTAVSPAATAEMQAAIPRLEKKRLGGLDNKSATQRIYSLQHMSRCTGFILGPVFGGFIEFRYDWKAMTIALGVLAGATAIPAFWLSGQDHKAKRAIRNDTVEEREPLLGSSDLKSSFATFGEGSSRNITQVSSFHTNKSSLRRKPPSVPLGHRLITAAERPDLWHPTHSDPNNDLFVFPQWSQGAVLKRYYRQLGEIEELAHYQTMIVRNSDERVIATGVCTPFYWPELAEVSEASLQSNKLPQCASTLPDGGWETILARGVLQARARRGDNPSTETSPLTEDQKNDETIAWLRNKPNAMSGLLVVVAESHRGNRLATVLHENFKKLAHQNDLKALVLPVRPTHKNQYPYTPFEQYFAWIQEGPFRPGFMWPSSNKPEDPLPFDRGLRKHIRMGAKAIKPAVRSFTVVASAAEWQQRLGDSLTLDTFTDENGELCVSGEKLDGFLLEDEDQPVPLKWDSVRQVGIYAETDMWMWHQL